MRISATTLSSGARLLTIGVVLLLCAPLAREQQDERRDGNWWLDLDRAAKLAYITGFLDGINLGRDFTYWGLDKSDETTPLVMQKIKSSFDGLAAKYLIDATNGQLVDGLDKFYGDFRNRRIKANGAVWLVLNEIAGKPEADMQRMIENWRKNALQE